MIFNFRAHYRVEKEVKLWQIDLNLGRLFFFSATHEKVTVVTYDLSSTYMHATFNSCVQVTFLLTH